MGHFLHITGLVWLGGYGALRKVADLPSISSMLARTCFIVGGAILVVGEMCQASFCSSHGFWILTSHAGTIPVITQTTVMQEI